MSKLLLNYLTGFVELLYPRACACCGNPLLHQEAIMCTRCIYHIPRTNYHHIPVNPIAQLLWGRVNVLHTTAFYGFLKGGNYHRLIHRLKYKGEKEIGIFMGKLMGQEMKESPFGSADLIVPVPLHSSRQKVRGYNQSEMIALGMSESMEIPVNNELLHRTVATRTQTRKKRFDRWKNVEDLFAAKENHGMEGKHLLLVDDVITTGATLEACIQALNHREIKEVSVAVMAHGLG